jgi:hypothetical protein
MVWVSSRPRRHRGVLLALGLMVWAVMLANTALEPTPGQNRYRMPLEPVFLLLTATCLWELADWWRGRVRPSA